MTKSELQNGDVVEVRCGYKYIKIDDALIRDNGYNYISGLKEDLLYNDSDINVYDIVAVYRGGPFYQMFDKWGDMRCIWKREEPKIKLQIKN